jgi:hypothetical protein
MNTSILPLAEIGGLPFLDDGVQTGKILSAAAICRRTEGAGHSGPAAATEYGRYLDPAIVLAIRAKSSPALLPGRTLTPVYDELVRAALHNLGEAVPAWNPLLGLPVRFLELWPPTGAISASCWAWPQHVLVAAQAFADPIELREQICHELCHQWLYLIEEAWPLQHPGAEHRILPSGTADRSPAEVIGAAHVAAALTRLYQAVPVPGGAARLEELRRYLGGCLDLLDTATADLTPAGHQITHRLKEVLR